MAPGARLRCAAQPFDRRAHPTRRVERGGLSRGVAGRAHPLRLDRPVPDTTFLGLPTRATWEAAQLQLRAAWDSFPTAIAPVVPTGGFITAVILLVWLLAYAADDFAHRAEAPIEAAVPSGVMFLVGTALGATATACWRPRSGWPPRHSPWPSCASSARRARAGSAAPAAALATTVRVGAGLAAAAVIIGVIAGPALPGASSDPLVDTRQGRSSRPRSARSSTSRPGWSTRATRSCSPSPAPGRPTGASPRSTTTTCASGARHAATATPAAR